MELKEKLLVLIKENKVLNIDCENELLVLSLINDEINIKTIKGVLDNNVIKEEIISDEILTHEQLEKMLNDDLFSQKVFALYEKKEKRDALMTEEYNKIIYVLNEMNIKEEDKNALKDIFELCLKNSYYNFDRDDVLVLIDPFKGTIGFKLLNLKISNFKEFSGKYEDIIKRILAIKHRNNNLFLNMIAETKEINKEEENQLK